MAACDRPFASAEKAFQNFLHASGCHYPNRLGVADLKRLAEYFASRQLWEEAQFDSFGKPGISERYAAPLVAKRPEAWRLVFTAPDQLTCVYERNR